MFLMLRKLLKWFSLTLIALLVLLVIAAFVIQYIYKDRLIKFAVEQVNKQVDARIDVRHIDFTFWRTFPNASVEFQNVLIQSSRKFREANHISRSDTLVSANFIYLEFSIIDLIQSNFNLKQISIFEGTVNILTDSKGLANFDIIKASENKVDNSYQFQLNSLLIKKSHLNINMINCKFDFSSYLNKFLLTKLIVDGNKYNINTELKNTRLSYSNEYSTLIKSIEVSTDVIFNTNILSFLKAEIGINKMEYVLDGVYKSGNQARIDLHFTGNDNDLVDLYSFLPASLYSKISDYRIQGSFSLDATFNGLLSDGIPAINLKIDLLDGSFTHKISGIAMDHIFSKFILSYDLFKGTKTSNLKLIKFRSEFQSGHISLDGFIQDLLKPKINMNVSYDLKLNDLKEFFKLDTMEVLEGKAECHANVKGSLKSASDVSLSDLLYLNYSGEIKLSDADFKLKGNDYRFEKVNGSVFLGDDIKIKDLQFFVHNNDYLVNGTLSDFGPYYRKEVTDLNLQAEVTSRNLDLSKYFEPSSQKAKGEFSRELLFPDHLNCDVKLHVNNFKLHSFNSKWINAKLSYKPRMFIIQSLSFEAFSGRMSGNGAILQDMNKNFAVRGQLDLSKVEVRQLFTGFDNFSQSVIRDENLRGFASGSVQISAQWDNSLKLRDDLLLLDADLTIINGELVNFEPMKRISKFVKIDDVNDIKFNTLKNHIYIKDKQIVIPNMEISSTSLSLVGSGIHSFDNQYTYKVKMLLSDVLWGRAKRAKHQNEEFGFVEDDGVKKASLYLTIVGIGDQFKVKYDTKSSLGVLKEGLTDQKQELKTIFKDKFGWYKNDTVNSSGAKPNTKSKIKVDWDESDPSKEDKVSEKTSPPAKVKDHGKIQVEFE